jgi:hypothetical protein
LGKMGEKGEASADVSFYREGEREREETLVSGRLRHARPAGLRRVVRLLSRVSDRWPLVRLSNLV